MPPAIGKAQPPPPVRRLENEGWSATAVCMALTGVRGERPVEGFRQRAVAFVLIGHKRDLSVGVNHIQARVATNAVLVYRAELRIDQLGMLHVKGACEPREVVHRGQTALR